MVKKITEADMENSIVLLGLKGQQLMERLIETNKRLKAINKSGQEMDGNTSTNEEEDFIFAMKKEMPEVFENIETTLALLKEIDRIVSELKQTTDADKMQIL